MTERSTITQSVQVGVEAGAGAVATTKILPSIQITTGLDGAFTEQRGSGNKYVINQIPGKEWSVGKIGGNPTYDELTYLLCSILSYAAPATVDTSGKAWTLPLAAITEDVVKMYTIEQGSATRAQKIASAQVTELTLSGTRDAITLAGSIMGQAFTDGITLTAGNTAVAAIPMLPKHVTVYSDATSAGLGVTKLTRVLSWELSIKNRFSPLWVVDASATSYVASMEAPLDATFKLKLEADASGMGFLTNARAGTKKFIRLDITSDQLAGSASAKYSLLWDMCCEVNAFPNEISDQDGVYAVEWPFTIVYDPTWTKAMTTILTNKLTAL